MTKPRKKSSSHTKNRSSADRRSAERPNSSDAKPRRGDGTRETIESVVVAFILAFLFRTFEAEAFVIPTGSMAPTLLGRHKDVQCDQCGVWFTVGASDEIQDERDPYPGYFDPHDRIETAFCPNCRFENPVRNEPVFKGDRILVNKFPYEFGEPKRWDVIVFKYPEDPSTNYIKRLVALPGEMIKVQRGDVYVRRNENEDWTILRKDDPDKQQELQLLVHDNDHQAPRLHEHGWPERWAAVERDNRPESIAGWSETDAGWQLKPKERSFDLKREAAAAKWQWIRYRHLVPSQEVWEAIRSGSPSSRLRDPQPQLIADFSGYNAYTGGDPHGENFGVYWVGDLTVTCEVNVREIGPHAQILLELNEGVRRYQCQIDPHTGGATLRWIEDDLMDQNEPIETVLATAETDFTETGTYEIRFANVDDRLCLWIDGDLVDFGSEAEYSPPGLPAPQQADLIPAGIAAQDLDVRVSHLLLQRDVYYRSEHVVDENDFGKYPNDHDEYNGPYGRGRLSEYLSDPDRWYEEYEQNAKPAIFSRLSSDEYFVLGDNSPRSKDSRLWSNTRRATHRHAVPRSALVGKAFFIYWPHAVPFGIPYLTDEHGTAVLYHKSGPGEGTDYPSFRIPFYPHVTRMHRIR